MQKTSTETNVYTLLSLQWDNPMYQRGWKARRYLAEQSGWGQKNVCKFTILP